MELRNDQVETEQHQGGRQGEQRVSRRLVQRAGTAAIHAYMCGRDQADAGGQQHHERDGQGDLYAGHQHQGSPVDLHRTALRALDFLAFLSGVAPCGYALGDALASTKTSRLSVTLLWSIR